MTRKTEKKTSFGKLSRNDRAKLSMWLGLTTAIMTAWVYALAAGTWWSEHIAGMASASFVMTFVMGNYIFYKNEERG